MGTGSAVLGGRGESRAVSLASAHWTRVAPVSPNWDSDRGLQTLPRLSPVENCWAGGLRIGSAWPPPRHPRRRGLGCSFLCSFSKSLTSSGSFVGLVDSPRSHHKQPARSGGSQMTYHGTLYVNLDSFLLNWRHRASTSFLAQLGKYFLKAAKGVLSSRWLTV